MLIMIRGAGDIATGAAVRLFRAGFDIVLTEIDKPTAIRRSVSFSEAVYNRNAFVEGIECVLVATEEEVAATIKAKKIPLIIDADAKMAQFIKPDILVDAILAKCNLGTNIHMANIVVALGPGFEAGVDCHAVIETMRGHDLGRVYYEGCTIPNTGIPGDIAGYTERRVLRAPCDGVFHSDKHIGDKVSVGEVIAYASETEIFASINGVLRGVLPNGITVYRGMKCGDIDPRGVEKHCFSVSDKARSVGGGVLEAICCLLNKNK